MMKALVAVAILIAPSFLAPAAAAADSSETSAEAPKEKLICRADRATGSRVRVNRVCLTREQWTEVDEKKRKSMENLNRGGSVSPCGPTGMSQAGCGGQ